MGKPASGTRVWLQIPYKDIKNHLKSLGVTLWYENPIDDNHRPIPGKAILSLTYHLTNKVSVDPRILKHRCFVFIIRVTIWFGVICGRDWVFMVPIPFIKLMKLYLSNNRSTRKERSHMLQIPDVSCPEGINRLVKPI